MGVSTSNLTMGPGTYFDAPFGALEPTTPAIAPASPWRDVGGTSDGIELASSEEFTELVVDQLIDTPERRRTKREFGVTLNLAETTLDNLALTLNEPTPPAPVSGVGELPITTGLAAFAPKYRACLFDGPAPGGGNRRIILRKSLSTDGTKFAYKKDGQNVYSMTRTGHHVSDVIAPLSVKDIIPEP